MEIPFLAVPNRINETIEMERAGNDPETVARSLSRRKAESLSSQYPDQFILGMDTIVVIDKKIIGKPKNKADALRILGELNARWHTVITAITLFNSRRAYAESQSVRTKVKFRELSEEEMMTYIETGESLDKAGAYGIQSEGAALVETIEGDFSNVVGFPERTVLAMLKRAGIYDHETEERKRQQSKQRC